MARTSETPRLYHFLSQFLFFELVASTLLVMALLTALTSLGLHLRFRFLYWNLFLAWIPYLSSLVLFATYRSRAPLRYLSFLPGLLWLIFFPNAPYIVTDVVHMYEIGPFGWSFNLGIILIFAWIGLFLAVVSLHMVHLLLSEKLGKAGGWAVVLLLIVVCGMGVYLGRVERWNSWDVLHHPHTIMKDVIIPLLHPRTHLGIYGFVLVYSMLLFVSYITFYAARMKPLREKR